MLSAKHRDQNLQSCDDISPHHQRSISMGKPNSPRKANDSLPLPMHIRAASTPAHIETPRPDTAQYHHKRYPSCVETTTRHNNSDPGLMKKDASKKFSVDNYTMRTVEDTSQNKRASSEAKEKLANKRNASSPASISLLNLTNDKQQRHYSDEGGKSPTNKQKSMLKATPELLAELLRGSSEKMVTAERERNKKASHAEAISLPPTVLKYLVSLEKTLFFSKIFSRSLAFAQQISFSHEIMQYQQTQLVKIAMPFGCQRDINGMTTSSSIPLTKMTHSTPMKM